MRGTLNGVVVFVGCDMGVVSALIDGVEQHNYCFHRMSMTLHTLEPSMLQLQIDRFTGCTGLHSMLFFIYFSFSLNRILLDIRTQQIATYRLKKRN